MLPTCLSEHLLVVARGRAIEIMHDLRGMTRKTLKKDLMKP
jgi:hypothetical protein